jgi:hypothetical protein
MVPFMVFLDDSGTDPKQSVAIASAMIVPSSVLGKMKKEWDRLTEKEGFTDFHTSVFVARNPKSQFAGWEDPKHERVFRRVREITKKYSSQNITYAVNKADYESIVPDRLRKLTGRHPYTWALRHVARFAETWRAHKEAPPLQWVFDFMKPSDDGRKEVEELFEQAEEQALIGGASPGGFTDLDFQSRVNVPSLQCADLLAWTNYRFAVEKFYDTKPHPFAITAWTDFNSMPVTEVPPIHPRGVEWNFAVSVKPDHLRKWVQKEIEDGSSIKRFDEFHARKTAEKSNDRRRR